MSSDQPAPTNPLTNAAHWLHDQGAALAHGLASLGLSKPVAELVTTVEETLGRALPAALAAGEKSILDQLTPDRLQALEQSLVTIVGEIGAVAVKQLLARTAVAAVAASTTL